VQLVAKNIIREDEWEDIAHNVKYDFLEDNHYSELKDAEILTARMATLQQVDPFVGKYYSMQWVRKNILRLDNDQIEEIEKEIDDEEQLHMSNAEQEGMQQGMQQTAANNYIQQNSIPAPEEEQKQEQPAKKKPT
jgi:hypothetical protein